MIIKELKCYEKILFEQAAEYDKRRKFILIVVLLLLITSLYASGLHLYILVSTAFILQFCSLFLDLRSKKLTNLAHDFKKYSMLINVFKDRVDTYDISSLKIKAGNSVNKMVTSELNINAEECRLSDKEIDANSQKKLMIDIQENSYWNQHLYKYSYKSERWKVILVTSLVTMATLAFIPVIKLDQDYTLFRLFFTIISFGIIYEYIITILTYKNASKAMEVIDHKISRLDFINLQELLNIYSKYHLVIATTPPIPKVIYEKNKKMLNENWDTRTLDT